MPNRARLNILSAGCTYVAFLLLHLKAQSSKSKVFIIQHKQAMNPTYHIPTNAQLATSLMTQLDGLGIWSEDTAGQALEKYQAIVESIAGRTKFMQPNL